VGDIVDGLSEGDASDMCVSQALPGTKKVNSEKRNMKVGNSSLTFGGDGGRTGAE